MSYSPVGDTVAIIHITWQVYNKVYVVARDAPKEYSRLLADLRVFSDQLKIIRDRFEGNIDAPAESLRTVLKRSTLTLVEFKEKLAKYNDLGRSERESRLRRMQWVKEQAAINDFRQKLANHQRDIQFALTVTGLSSETDRPDQAVDNDFDSGFAELHASDLCPACSSSQMRRINTTESSTGIRSARGPLVASPTVPCTCFQNVNSTSSAYMRRRTHEYDRRPSNISTSSTGCPSCNETIYHVQSSSLEHDKSALDSTSEFLSDTPRRASTKPVQPDSAQQKHDAAANIQESFREDYDSKKKEVSLESWLCIATWWMIKSRAILKLSQPEEEASGTHWTTTTSSQQCYADLLKSSWILEEIIMTDPEIFDAHQRRTLSHLGRALDEDLTEYREEMAVFRDGAGMDSLTNKPSLKLTETFEQTIEEQAMNDPSSAHRWIDVDQDDRGSKDEKIIFQTFVNAQLGDKDQRDKSRDAPYTLLLWTMRGETGLFVSLCNQSGTVNLARSVVAEDLKEYERGRVASTLVLEFDFPNQQVEIRFVNADDVHDFFKTPKRIFDKMSDQRPRPGEVAIFQNPIQSCTDRSLPAPYRAQQDKLLKSGKYSSCGLRLYESSDEQCWKTTRRLVVSSTPEDDFEIECLSYWLPLDQIQLTVHKCEVTLAWSDCGQLMYTTEGNWDGKYYFIYNPDRPNRKLILQFESIFDASSFEECLLFPTEIPPYAAGFPPQVSLLLKIERPSVHQDIRIYRLFDQDDLDNKYHAIVHAHKSPHNFHISYIHYVYLDIDWIFSDYNSRNLDQIEFPDLISPDYQSSLRRLPYEPRYCQQPNKMDQQRQQDPIPIFKSVIESSRTANLSLGCQHNLAKFMYALTGWQLIFYHLCPKINLPGNERHKNVPIQLWAKLPTSEVESSALRLAIRFPNPISSHSHPSSPSSSVPAAFERRRWMTAELSMQHSSGRRDELELKDATVWRGSHVDIVEMIAMREGGAGGSMAPDRRRCKIVLAFGEGGDREQFVQLVFGRR